MANPDLQRASLWAEAVFHVLAHVDVGPIAASCHDVAWIAWAAEHLGPSAQRPLADDVQVLARALASHERLAAAQALAWAWNDEAQVKACVARDLATLAATDVADPNALAAACALGPAVEVLRAAAELELPLLGALDRKIAASCTDRPAALPGALSAIADAAPELARVSIAVARPLPHRGRAWRGAVLVGEPGIAGAVVDHVAWQAAHEATVIEVQRSATWLARQSMSFAAVERTALGLLRSRARRAGLADDHAQWFARLDLRALGPIPDVDDDDD